jgi:AcrR family transcriptional regulator
MVEAVSRPVPPQLTGRRAEAERNDRRILAAAREVFLANPEAPIAAVAGRASVGISALYRRYKSKDELLQRLAIDGLQRYIAEADAMLADADDPARAFDTFMQRSVDAGANSLTQRLAGSFTLTDEVALLGQHAHAVTQRVLDRARGRAGVRQDIEVGDLSLLFEQLASIRVRDPERSRALRQRYLALLLIGLHTPETQAEPLPGPPPSWDELRQRYDARQSGAP